MKRILSILLAVVSLLAFVVYSTRFASDDASLPTADRFDALGTAIEQSPPGLTEAGVGLGVLLLGAWLFGKLFAAVNLPKISGFLLFGMLVGPSILDVVTKDQLPYLRLVNDLAIARIALIAGSEIHLRFLRSMAKPIALIASLQMGLILCGVGVVAFFMMRPFGLSEFDATVPLIIIALMIATVATAGSPAVLVAVITELNAKSAMAQLGLAVTVAKDLILVALFAVVISVGGAVLEAPNGQSAPQNGQDAAQFDHQSEAQTDQHQTESDSHAAQHSLTRELVVHLGGSLVAGVLIGLGLAWYIHRINAHLPIFVVMACFGIAFFSES
ncbi:MAG: cation:proton antiporter, partial [Planctomycetota bacterium]|nr:cation:proton antiporter [Planctomycetota bacterium]